MRGIDSSTPQNKINTSGAILMLMKGFGSRVRIALDLSGVKIRDLAKHCGIDPSTADKWLHDDRDISTIRAENLYAAADYMKVSARWLGTGVGSPRPEREGLSFTAKKLADDIEKLPPDAQLAISALLNTLKRN